MREEEERGRGRWRKREGERGDERPPSNESQIHSGKDALP